MKKIKSTKLTLTTETIKQLDDAEMQRVAGGWTNTCLGTECQCAPTYGPNCPTQGFTNCICLTKATCYTCP